MTSFSARAPTCSSAPPAAREEMKILTRWKFPTCTGNCPVTHSVTAKTQMVTLWKSWVWNELSVLSACLSEIIPFEIKAFLNWKWNCSDIPCKDWASLSSLSPLSLSMCICLSLFSLYSLCPLSLSSFCPLSLSSFSTLSLLSVFTRNVTAISLSI